MFDYYSELDFKFLVLDFALNQVQLGHSTPSGGWVVDKVVAKTLNAITNYGILLALRGASISVTVAGQLVLSHGYNSALVDGRFGLLTDGTATFDNVRVQTNDAKFDEYQPGTAQVFISDVTVTEGGNAVLTVTLSQPLAQDVTVQWATGPGTALPGVDFTGASGTVTFFSGETSKQIGLGPIAPDPFIQTINDAIYEVTETFNVTLANPSGGVTIGDGVGVVTITDNDTAPAVSVTATNGGEGSGPVVATFTRTGPTTGTLDVNISTVGGTAVGADVTGPTPVGGTLVGSVLTFAIGSSTVTLTYGIVDDALVEGPETIIFTVAPGTGYTPGTASSATATIVDNDAAVPPAVTVSGSGGVEGGASVTITFTRTGSTASTLSINTSRIGTWTDDLFAPAVTGGTYSVGTGVLTFNAGVSTVVLTFPVVNDNLVEGTETFGYNVLAGTGYTLGSPSAVNVTITDNDVPAVTVGATDGGEGAGPIIITFSRTGPTTGPLSVNTTRGGTATYAGIPGADFSAPSVLGGTYNTSSGALVFDLGFSTVTLTYNIVDDALGRGPGDARVHRAVRNRVLGRRTWLGDCDDLRQRFNAATPATIADRHGVGGQRRRRRRFGRRDIHPDGLDLGLSGDRHFDDRGHGDSSRRDRPGDRRRSLERHRHGDVLRWFVDGDADVRHRRRRPGRADRDIGLRHHRRSELHGRDAWLCDRQHHRQRATRRRDLEHQQHVRDRERQRTADRLRDADRDSHRQHVWNLDGPVGDPERHSDVRIRLRQWLRKPDVPCRRDDEDDHDPDPGRQEGRGERDVRDRPLVAGRQSRDHVGHEHRGGDDRRRRQQDPGRQPPDRSFGGHAGFDPCVRSADAGNQRMGRLGRGRGVPLGHLRGHRRPARPRPGRDTWLNDHDRLRCRRVGLEPHAWNDRRNTDRPVERAAP